MFSHAKKLQEAKARLKAAEKAGSPETLQLKETFCKLDKEMEQLKKREEELKLKEKVTFYLSVTETLLQTVILCNFRGAYTGDEYLPNSLFGLDKL